VPSHDQQVDLIAGNADGELADPNQSEPLSRQTMNDVPADFLPLSHAVNRLADGMWGGLQRPEPVVAIKRVHKKLSLGSGPWERGQDDASGQRP
jgi:hypothetical protein